MKYASLASEYKKIYKLQTVETIPLTATGLVNKTLEANLSKLQLNVKILRFV